MVPAGTQERIDCGKSRNHTLSKFAMQLTSRQSLNVPSFSCCLTEPLSSASGAKRKIPSYECTTQTHGESVYPRSLTPVLLANCELSWSSREWMSSKNKSPSGPNQVCCQRTVLSSNKTFVCCHASLQCARSTKTISRPEVHVTKAQLYS